MRKELPSREYVASLLDYDPQTGILTWKIARNNRVKVGQSAGCLSPAGYLVIGVDDRRYLAHRLAWFLAHGEWPAGQIDHINGEKADNRLSNLRACSVAENSWNRKMRSDNKTGVKGVSWNEEKKAWNTLVIVGGQRISAGLFSEIEEAKRAIMALREQHHGSFANHGT